MRLPRRLVFGFFILLFVLFFGTAGYSLIEGWSLFDSFYMTVITISTVGFKEVKSLSPGGRIFTSFLIFMGVGFMFYILSYLVQYFIEERFEEGFWRRRMRERISKLRDHVIVCGYGRVGREVSNFLEEDETDFVLIERDERNFEEARRRGILSILGDATKDEVLKEAGIERARAVVVATGDDTHNLFITLTARYLNPGVFIIARASSEEAEPKLLRAGADKVISPQKLGGRRMARLVTRPLLVDFIDTVLHGKEKELIIEDIKVSSDSPILGKTKREIEKSSGIFLIAIKRRDGELIPSPSDDTRLEGDDELIVIGSKEGIRMLGG